MRLIRRNHSTSIIIRSYIEGIEGSHIWNSALDVSRWSGDPTTIDRYLSRPDWEELL